MALPDDVASCQTQTVPYMEIYILPAVCPLDDWNKNLHCGSFILHALQRWAAFMWRAKKESFFRIYTLLSPIIPDQSQKNVGEKSADNNGATWLRFGAFVCCAGRGPRSGSNASNERWPHFSFELICSVTHRRTKAACFLWALVRTDYDIIPTRLSGKGLRSRMCKLNTFLLKWQNKSGLETVNRILPAAAGRVAARERFNDGRFLPRNIIRSN